MEANVSLSCAPVNVIPRGMVNPQNACYMNTVLQCLVHCPPLYHYFMQHLQPLKLPSPSAQTLSSSPCPVLQAMMELYKEFAPCAKGSPDRLTPAKPFSPHYIWAVVQQRAQAGGAMSVATEEDAQEFLGFLLDAMHAELLELSGKSQAHTASKKGKQKKKGGDADDDEWAEVRKGNKSSVVTEVSHQRSAISSIFYGTLGSHVHRTGSQATVTKQPFSVLPLEIHHASIQTLEDALYQLTVPCDIEAKSGSARTSMLIEAAPVVLVLHLKRWILQANGVPVKTDKHISFDSTLVLNSRIFPQGKPDQRRYRLIGVIVHSGKNSYSGHYIGYIPVYNNIKEEVPAWLQFNDTRCVPVAQEYVKQQPAYILLYMLENPAAVAGAPGLPIALRQMAPGAHAAPAQPKGGAPNAGTNSKQRARADVPEYITQAAQKLAQLTPKLGIVVAGKALPVIFRGSTAMGMKVVSAKGECQLLQVDDVIVFIDDCALETQAALSDYLKGCKVGQEVSLTAIRGDEELNFRCRLGCQLTEDTFNFLTRVAKGKVHEGDEEEVKKVEIVAKNQVPWSMSCANTEPTETKAEPAGSAEKEEHEIAGDETAANPKRKQRPKKKKNVE